MKAYRNGKGFTKIPAKKPTTPYDYKPVHFALNKLAGMSASGLAKHTSLAAGTIAKLRRAPKDGGTKHPRAYTVDELFRLAGYERRPVPIGDPVQVPAARERTKKKVKAPKSRPNQTAELIPFPLAKVG